MGEEDRTKEQLIHELAALRQRVAKLEASEAMRKRAEEALAHERNLLRTLIDNLPDYIYVKDTESRFVIGNIPVGGVMGAATPDELVGKTDFDFYPQELAAQYYADEQELIRSGQSLVNREEPLMDRVKGRRGWLLTTKVPLRDSDGRIVGLVGIGRDITERKQAEEALRKARDELEIWVEERTAELAKANKELQAEITERKQAEEALAWERYLLNTLMDNVPDAIYFKDTDSRFIRTNKAHAKRWFGLSDPAQAVGKTDFDFFSEEHARRAYEDEQEIIRTGQPLLNMEEKETWPDRPDTWVVTSKMPLRDEEGKIIGTFGITRDITERKQAEEALAGERNLLRSLIDNVPDYIYVKDTESRFLTANPALVRLIGVATPDDLVGKTDFDFFPPELAAKYYADEQAIFQSGQPLLEHEEPTVDTAGNPRWVSTTKVPLRDVQGKIFGLVGMGRDITERKRIEEALAQEQYLMQALMDNIPDYIYFKDLESRFIRISKAHAQSFGLSDPAQAVGKTDFDFFTEEHARPAYEDEQRIIRTGQPLVDMEEKETRPDRPDAWVLTTKMPLRDEDGRIVGTFGLSRDITERKQAEAERERLLTTLEHRNAHLQTAAEVARTATSILDVGQLLPRVVDLISEHFGYYQVNVFLIDESGQWAVLRAATGEAGQQMLKDGARLPVGGQSIVGWVTGTGQPHVSQDIASDPLYLPHSRLPDTRAEAVIPLVVGDAVIGALDVESAQPNVFGPNAIPILTIMADQVAIAIENSRLYAKVQQLAITDGLTGLYNRRGFFELGRHEFERARRFGRPLAAVMLDLDYLKEVNDTYGHAVGDQVLAGVGVLCRGELREVDLLGRYGGDEFVALLPECDVAGAKGVAERLRQSIAQTPVKTERGAVTMSVSLGVAVLDKGCADLEGLLNRADQALLRAAKRAGRNRVSVWNGH